MCQMLQMCETNEILKKRLFKQKKLLNKFISDISKILQ